MEWASEGEHEEEEAASASEAGESERMHESVGADGVGDLHIPQASQEDDNDEPAKVENEAASATEEEDWEEDNERSERRFGYDPEREVDVWEEYQAVSKETYYGVKRDLLGCYG